MVGCTPAPLAPRIILITLNNKYVNKHFQRPGEMNNVPACVSKCSGGRLLLTEPAGEAVASVYARRDNRVGVFHLFSTWKNNLSRPRSRTGFTDVTFRTYVNGVRNARSVCVFQRRQVSFCQNFEKDICKCFQLLPQNTYV